METCKCIPSSDVIDVGQDIYDNKTKHATLKDSGEKLGACEKYIRKTNNSTCNMFLVYINDLV